MQCGTLHLRVSRLLKKQESQTSRQQESAEETFSNLAEEIFSALLFDVSQPPLSTDFCLTHHRCAPASCPSCPRLNRLGFLCPRNPGCSWCIVHSPRCLLAFCFQTVPCLLLARHVLRLSAATKPGKEMQPTFVLKINKRKVLR